MTGDKDFQHEFHDIHVRHAFNMINQSCDILKDFVITFLPLYHQQKGNET